MHSTLYAPESLVHYICDDRRLVRSHGVVCVCVCVMLLLCSVFVCEHCRIWCTSRVKIIVQCVVCVRESVCWSWRESLIGQISAHYKQHWFFFQHGSTIDWLAFRFCSSNVVGIISDWPRSRTSIFTRLGFRGCTCASFEGGVLELAGKPQRANIGPLQTAPELLGFFQQVVSLRAPVALLVSIDDVLKGFLWEDDIISCNRS